ncbi:hypothetical protein [Streptomyces sp. NPDC050428]|uniref:hypothetical protein n=1 Tax=Streptomyces sp. NPDC050428 TaxID=3155757 RepID=UPI0034332859
MPLSRWVTRRAVALAGLALAGAVIAGAGPVRLSTAELITLMLAAVACTVLLWSLPAAMREPTAASVHLPIRATVHQPAETTVHRTAEGVSTRWTSPPAP